MYYEILCTSYFVTNHATEKVKGTQTNRLILVIETLQHEVLVSLDTLRVSLQDLRHRQQTQVLHYNRPRYFTKHMSASQVLYIELNHLMGQTIQW